MGRLVRVGHKDCTNTTVTAARRLQSSIKHATCKHLDRCQRIFVIRLLRISNYDCLHVHREVRKKRRLSSWSPSVSKISRPAVLIKGGFLCVGSISGEGLKTAVLQRNQWTLTWPSAAFILLYPSHKSTYSSCERVGCSWWFQYLELVLCFHSCAHTR